MQVENAVYQRQLQPSASAAAAARPKIDFDEGHSGLSPRFIFTPRGFCFGDRSVAPLGNTSATTVSVEASLEWIAR